MYHNFSIKAIYCVAFLPTEKFTSTSVNFFRDTLGKQFFGYLPVQLLESFQYFPQPSATTHPHPPPPTKKILSENKILNVFGELTFEQICERHRGDTGEEF